MPRRDHIMDDFSGGMNNAADPSDIFRNEAEYLEGLVGDIPGQLRTMGAEASMAKLFTGFQTVQGSGLFHTLMDRNRAGTEQETEWLLTVDKDTGIVGVLEYASIGGQPSAGTVYTTLSPTMDIGTTSVNGVFHNFDGTLRGCNANYGGTPKYYGYIKRNKFTGAGANAYQDDEFIAESTLLAPPPSFTFRNNDDGLNTSLGALSTQVALLTFSTPGNPNYRWVKEFEGALSYVYDNSQESLLTVSSATVDVSDLVNPDVTRATMLFAISGTEAQIEAQLNKRITHAKFYMREVGTNNWYLQGIYDFDKGGSLPGSDVKRDWGYDTTGTDYYWTANTVSSDFDEYMDEPLITDSYISETGHSPDEKVIDIGNSGDGWKASVILNRQVYLFGVKAKDKDGIQKVQGDLILRSEPGQPDKFLRSNALIVTTGDGDHSVYGLGLDDRIFEFKRNAVTVTNVAQTEFIEETFNKGGIDNADKAVATDYGVALVNTNGIFLYTRNGFVDLFKREGNDGKLRQFIDLDWFNTNIYVSGACAIAYNKYHQQIIVTNYSSGKMIIYDMPSGSVSYGTGNISTVSSNFVIDTAGNTLFLKDVVNDVHLYKFDFDETAYSNAQYWGKEETFDNPGVKKYIYTVKISYRNSIAQNLDDNVEIYLDNVSFRMVGQMLASQNEFVEATYVMPSSAVSNECKKAQVRVGGYDYSAGVVAKITKLRINRIIINARILPNAR